MNRWLYWSIVAIELYSTFKAKAVAQNFLIFLFSFLRFTIFTDQFVKYLALLNVLQMKLPHSHLRSMKWMDRQTDGQRRHKHQPFENWSWCFWSHCLWMIDRQWFDGKCKIWNLVICLASSFLQFFLVRGLFETKCASEIYFLATWVIFVVLWVFKASWSGATAAAVILGNCGQFFKDFFLSLILQLHRMYFD